MEGTGGVYLEENGVVSTRSELNGHQIKPEKISEGDFFKYLLYKEKINDLVFRKIEGTDKYYIEANWSPVIEFTRLPYNSETNTLKRGRLYYTKSFLNANDEWQEKSEDFILKAEALFKWFKKNDKDTKLPEWKGFLITPKVKEKIEKEGLILTQV